MGRSAKGKGENETFTVKYWFAPAQGFEVFRWFLGSKKLLYTMGFKNFYDKRPHLLLWAGSRHPRGKVTIICVPNCLSCGGSFIVYTPFTNGWVGDTCSIQCQAYAYIKMQLLSKRRQLPCPV